MKKGSSIILAVTTSLGLALDHPSADAADKMRITSNPESLQTCFAHVTRCIVPVYVHALDGGECSAWIDPGTIKVPQPATVPNDTFKPNHIKIVWVIKKGDPATKIGQFGFDPSAGVAPQGTTDQFQSEGLDGPDTDDPNPDDPADSASVSRRFRWVSTHKVTGVGLHFDLNINRVTKIGTVLVAKPCTAIDPLISNT